jgi:GNAT superfamily N-acetyltransferase
VDVRLELATEEDAAAIAAVRIAAARDLVARYGPGPWGLASDTVDGVRMEVAGSTVFIARGEGTVLATLRLSLNNPWLGDTNFFTPCERAVHLTAMAVSPAHQRQGIGRACLRDVDRIARRWTTGAIRLDSHDAPAGAREFYVRCGYREVARGNYLGTPLIWFERLVSETGVENAERARAQWRA